MAIDIDKILNIDIRDYVSTRPPIDVGLQKYEVRGVHSNKESLEEFAKLVPDEAEVVVNYEMQFHGEFPYGSRKVHWKFNQVGTALIPKDK